MKPEDQVKAAVWKALQQLGVLFLRLNSGKVAVKRGWMQLCPVGTADMLVCLQDRPPLWLELKAPGQTTSKDRRAAQAAFAETVRALGHVYVMAESVNEVLEAIQSLR